MPDRWLEVAYVLSAAYDVAHFGPVCKALNRRGHRAYFVVPQAPVWYRGAAKRTEKIEHYARIRELLEKHELPYEGRLNPAADVVLATQAAHCLRACRNTKLKAPYGAPSLVGCPHYLPEKNEGFDGFLVHGQLQKDTHAEFFAPSRMKIIGIPKYDAFFQNPPDPEALKRRLGISGTKPIITYLPTWDDRHSTIHRFHDAFLTMKERYSIVIKPHPHTQRLGFKTGELDKLRQITPFVLDACASTEEAIAVADLLVTDAKSGTSSESMYLTQARTPWVGITPHPAEAFFDLVAHAGPMVRKSNQLPEVISQMLREDRYASGRRTLIDYAYSCNAGRAAEDAADAIAELAEMEVISRGYPHEWNKLKRSLHKRIKKVGHKIGPRHLTATSSH